MMTKLVTIKKPEAVKLKGVTLDWTIEDGSATRLTITDKRGNSITLSKGESYVRGFTVMEPKPQETAERFALTGKARGVKVRELFPSMAEAERVRDDLAGYGATADLEIKPVTVPVDDDGELAVPADDLPPF
jgi:hypothetical protein